MKKKKKVGTALERSIDSMIDEHEREEASEKKEKPAMKVIAKIALKKK